MAALDNASSDETSRKRKIVCVQVETGNDSKSYEIAHQSTDNSEVDIILFTLRNSRSFLLQNLMIQAFGPCSKNRANSFRECGQWLAIIHQSKTGQR